MYHSGFITSYTHFGDMLLFNYSPCHLKYWICTVISGQSLDTENLSKQTTKKNLQLENIWCFSFSSLRSALHSLTTKSIANSYKHNISRSEYAEDLSDSKVLNVPEGALFQCSEIVSGKFVNLFVLHKEVISLLCQVEWKIERLVLTHRTEFLNNIQWKRLRSQPNYVCSLYHNLLSTTCFGLYAGHLQVLSDNITKVKLLLNKLKNVRMYWR
jgi:hypothetical protein